MALQHQDGAENVAVHQVKALAVGNLVQFRDILGRGAVEAVEVVGLVTEIGDVRRKPDARDDILAVKESVVDGIPFGIPGSLHVDLPYIIGIHGSVSILIDVGEGAVVPAQVGGIADGRQGPEIDACLLDFFLCGSGERGCKQDREGKQMFHCCD